ncbi:MAG TPA: NADH-quinone oxidoreductase subunit NuoG [Trueperaceae bacterium]|nr:NADH-quinone oxidoreductase subunit NuoG [Trueperaceae bacterium]
MKVKVNDVELELAPGTSAIDAVFAAGDDVPFFCSQEYMSPIGACRMCLARVGAPRKDKDGQWILDEETGEPKIFWFPNLMATCTTQVMEGMVIDTRSEPVKRAQNSMVEYHLINHPLDCPVCDKGGACELQDRAYEYGSGVSRFEFDKRHNEKHHALSELITLDRERCIHCKRCVRYFEEVPGDEVLDFIERGSHTYIGTAEAGLPSNFTGNITDICPVGALLDTTSRFRGRNWEYHHTPSVTMDDATGAAVWVDSRTGRIERVKGRLNPEVNKTWIDDGTRFGHEYVDHPSRLLTPLVRRGGELVPATWEEAAALVAERLAGLSGKDVGIAIRADSTLEEGVGALALAEHLGTGQVDHAPRPAASVVPPKGLGATIADLATADAILVVGDVSEEAGILDLRVKDALKGVTPPALLPHGVPIADLRLKERMPRDKAFLAVAAPYAVDLMRHARVALRYVAGQEAALFEALAGGTEAPTGLQPEALGAVADGLKGAERAVVVLGGTVLASREATDAALAFARAAGAKVLLVGPMANSRGLELLGVLPSHANYAYPAMLETARALVISHLDPAQDPDVAERLKQKELLVVHDSFMTETAAIADVVLPAKTVYERDGTVVSLEGRFLRVNAAPVEGGASEDLTGVVKVLGEALGQRLEGRSVRSAHRVLRQRFELELGELPEWGAFLDLRAPARALGAAPEQPAKRRGGNVVVAPSLVRPEYAYLNPHLLAERGGPALRVHPEDAAAHGLSDGDDVRLRVDGLWRRASVRVTDAVPVGMMTIPATPDQPQGLAHADLSSLAVLRDREAVAS